MLLPLTVPLTVPPAKVLSCPVTPAIASSSIAPMAALVIEVEGERKIWRFIGRPLPLQVMTVSPTCSVLPSARTKTAFDAAELQVVVPVALTTWKLWATEVAAAYIPVSRLACRECAGAEADQRDSVIAHCADICCGRFKSDCKPGTGGDVQRLGGPVRQCGRRRREVNSLRITAPCNKSLRHRCCGGIIRIAGLARGDRALAVTDDRHDISGQRAGSRGVVRERNRQSGGHRCRQGHCPGRSSVQRCKGNRLRGRTQRRRQ